MKIDSTSAIKWEIEGEKGKYVLILPIGSQIEEAVEVLKVFTATMANILAESEKKKEAEEKAKESEEVAEISEEEEAK